jgi:hypothetical protein
MTGNPQMMQMAWDTRVKIVLIGGMMARITKGIGCASDMVRAILVGRR